MTAEEQRLSEDQRQLVAIGASVGAGCQPCISHHLTAGAQAGLSAERLLGAVINGESASVDSQERMEALVREHLGPGVGEPRGASLLDEALASLGGALGANDLTSVHRHLQACRRMGVSWSQLREGIELGYTVQENANRMHFRAALDLLDRVTAADERPENEQQKGELQ